MRQAGCSGGRSGWAALAGIGDSASDSTSLMSRYGNRLMCGSPKIERRGTFCDTSRSNRFSALKSSKTLFIESSRLA